MSDVITVARKELREMIGEPASRRGVLVQGSVLTLMIGILVPAQNPEIWQLGSPIVALLSAMMGAVIAGGIGADAFSGERERKTLETLLSTPLSDGAIIGGKAIAALTTALVIVLLATVAATVTVNVVGHGAGLFIPAPHVIVGIVLGATASGALATAIAIALSIRIAVARSVQQIVSLTFVLPLLVGSMAWRRLGISFDWQNIYLAEVLALVLSGVGIVIASASFRRERIFLRR